MASYKRTDIQVLFHLLLEKAATDDSPKGLKKLHEVVKSDQRKLKIEIAETYYPRIKKDIQTAIEKNKQTISLSLSYMKELLRFLKFNNPDEFTTSTEELRTFFDQNQKQDLTGIALMGNYSTSDKTVFTKWLDKIEIDYSFGASKAVTLDEVAGCLKSNRIAIVFLPVKQKSLLNDKRWQNWVAESRVLPVYSESMISREEVNLTKWLKLDNWKKAIYVAFLSQFSTGSKEVKEKKQADQFNASYTHGIVFQGQTQIKGDQISQGDMVVNIQN